MRTTRRVLLFALLLAGIALAVTLVFARAPATTGVGPDAPSELPAEREALHRIGDAAFTPVTPVASVSTAESPPTRPDSEVDRSSSVEPSARAAVSVVRILDEHRAPIPGARVRADLRRADGTQLRVARAVTDARGIALVDARGASAVELRVTPSAEDFDHAECEVDRDVAAELVVQLATRRWIALTVLDEDGLPVVDVDCVELAGERGRVAAVVRCVEAASGVHAIEIGAAPGVAHVRSVRAGVGEHAYDPAIPSTKQGTVRLRRNGSIEALVTRDGTAVAGVRVALVERYERGCLTLGHLALGGGVVPSERFHGEQTSGADGRVAFAVHEFRTYALIAEAQGVGAFQRTVVADPAARGIEVALPLSSGGAVELRVVDAGARRIPVTLMGPGGTRRIAVLGGDEVYVADGLPAGEYVAARSESPGSGRHLELREDTRATIRLTAEPRCRLEVEDPHGLRLYAMACPGWRVPSDERRPGFAAVFESDDDGPHALVRVDDDVVCIRTIELEPADRSSSLELPDCDATLELVAPADFDGYRHRWRIESRDGSLSFHELRPDALRDPDTGALVAGSGWIASVSAGSCDLVRVAKDGSFEVVLSAVRVGSEETRRVLL